EAEIKAVMDDVKKRVSECEKSAEESPYPDKQQLYDMVYEQEDYPFLKHRL
ncbi:MAG TPA: pyruvate dehydrogenase (acetyl-transferring) E1 component subunit alpha, partial [Flavobacteriaceae bacterium]|nr:pyruvate dehydrogenase (acetyl-transferring) E1 component subunit alpha [Flavobacteriaceae bacterium]